MNEQIIIRLIDSLAIKVLMGVLTIKEAEHILKETRWRLENGQETMRQYRV